MKQIARNSLYGLLLLIGNLFYIPFTIATSAGESDMGLRADLNVGPGKPTNDMLGASVIGHIPLNNTWLMGLALSTARFDVERPNSELNLITSEKLDASASSTMLSGWIEKRINEEASGSYWFWSTGLGFNSVDVDNLKGTTNTGDDFEIEFDVDLEIELAFTAGQRHNIGNNWVVGYGLKAAYRFGEWNAKDLNSGRSNELYEGYDVSGAFAETSYRF